MAPALGAQRLCPLEALAALAVAACGRHPIQAIVLPRVPHLSLWAARARTQEGTITACWPEDLRLPGCLPMIIHGSGQ